MPFVFGAMPTDLSRLAHHHPIWVAMSSSFRCFNNQQQTCCTFRGKGIRVRHPHSHDVWTEPDSTSARRGMTTGVPLRVALEGKRSDRFLLDVTSLIGQGSEGGVNGGGGDGGTSKGVRSVLVRRCPRSSRR